MVCRTDEPNAFIGLNTYHMRGGERGLAEISDHAKFHITALARIEKAMEETEAERTAEQAKANRERIVLNAPLARSRATDAQGVDRL